jgi:hypothetical protein
MAITYEKRISPSFLKIQMRNIYTSPQDYYIFSYVFIKQYEIIFVLLKN